MTTTPLRTVLAVPAAAERFLSKAQGSTASALMVDLEDGVADPGKDEARVLLRQWADRLVAPTRRLWLRVNSMTSPHLSEDLAAVDEVRTAIDALVLPKACPEAVAELAALTDLPIVALIETPDGVEEARRTAAHPAVRALMFGALDYRAELARTGGLHVEDTSWAQARIVNAAAAAALPSIAGPTTAVDDRSLLLADCTGQAALGFTGKLCIHPAQLEPVQAAFGPTAGMADWARRIVAAADASPGHGAIAVDGAMVDKPVLDRAHRILVELQPDWPGSR